jgi:integrase/recombinase XerD
MRLTLKHRVLNSKARNGWHSFFIEVFDQGERRYESLDMVADPFDKSQYRQVVLLCEDLIAKRQLELKGLISGLKTPASEYASGDFVTFCQQVADKSLNPKTHENWQNAIKSLMRFAPHGLPFRKIDHHWLENFQRFLLDAYSQNTARTYSTQIRQAISKAHQEGYLTDNPNKLVKQVAELEGEIKYLYFEEIKLLHKTPHRHLARKTAFLFNCFVPVRSGDLANIKESNIRPDGMGGYEVYFRQSKKQRIESIPISPQGIDYLEQARELARKRLGRELAADDKIFDLGHKKWYGCMLKTWAERAFRLYGDELETEIRNHFSWACKDLSPHWARHTGATLLLNAGAQLDAVGDILGHKDKKTTMRYAKIHPRTKRSTIAMMPSINT